MQNKPIPDIIDNDSFPLKDAVNILLKKSNLSKMAVAFFHLSGFNSIKQNLNKVKSLKLLIGNSTDQETVDELAEGFIRLGLAKEYKEKYVDYQSKDIAKEVIDATILEQRKELELIEQTDENSDAIKTLAQLIEEGRIQVKIYTKSKLHSKVYLFEYEDQAVDKGIAIVGSSNLSISGFTYNSELNVLVRGNKNYEELNDWFDRLWKDAKDFDEFLLNIMKSSWALNQVKPYDIYLKTLYNLVKDRIEIDKTITVLDEMNLPHLYSFQRRAFHRAIKILERLGGVFISDVVGLGKSYIGTAILKYYRESRNQKALIICPKSLEKMWIRYNEDYGLGAKVYSMGLLQYPTDNKGSIIENYSLLDEEDLENYDIVLIDESHNFRNNTTERYKIIHPYLLNKKVVLVTATPQNKTVFDIYNQIKLFHQYEKSEIPIYPNELKKYFQLHENNHQKIVSLLQHILIRRKRKDIINSPAYDPNEKLEFPKRSLKTISYDIESTYGHKIYHKITLAIQKDLLYARYGLLSYLNPDAIKNKAYEGLSKAGRKLKGLMKILLFKRLESSANAFYETVGRMISVHKAFLEGLDRNIFISGRKSQEEILSFGDDVYNEELYDFLEAENAKYNLKDFNDTRLRADVTNDLKVLEDLHKLIEPIIKDPSLDSKLNHLIDLITNKIEEKKVLIFSEYEETAEYLYKRVTDELKKRQINRQIEFSAGGSDISDIMRRFSPMANTRNGKLQPHEKEIDILVSTDILSEGQNLQDCNTVINYDIHWNPVRLIQRIGRVDRIGSKAEVINVYNFLPETEIDKRLNLRERVHNRIQEIHNILGEDNQILDEREILNNKSIYDIYEGKEDVLDADAKDEMTALDEAEKTILELKNSDPEEYERIINIPDGVRSAKTSTKSKGTYVYCYCKHLDYHKLYHMGDVKGEINTDINEILEKIKCEKTTKKETLPKGYNSNVNKVFRDFENEAALLETEKEKGKELSKAQQYIKKELKTYFGQITDIKVREKVELLERIFTSDLPQYIISSLYRFKRDKVIGSFLVEKLVEIYNAFNLSELVRDIQEKKKKEKVTTKIICSEGLI